LIPGAGMTDRTGEQAQVSDIRDLEETRQASRAVAKVSLQNAGRVLSEVRARAQGAEVALKRASHPSDRVWV